MSRYYTYGTCYVYEAGTYTASQGSASSKDKFIEFIETDTYYYYGYYYTGEYEWCSETTRSGTTRLSPDLRLTALLILLLIVSFVLW